MVELLGLKPSHDDSCRMFFCVRRFLLLRQREAAGVPGLGCGAHLFRHQPPRDLGQCHKKGQCSVFCPPRSSSQHFGSAFNISCDTGVPTGKKEKTLFPPRSASCIAVAADCIFMARQLSKSAQSLEAPVSFISSKCPWVLDPRPSKEWKVRLKNETRGFAAGWVREEYQIRKLATAVISKSRRKAGSRVMEIPSLWTFKIQNQSIMQSSWPDGES